jgi:tRNA(His) guanylyltransferase
MTESAMDRMKRYEKPFRGYLPPRFPIIMRCDGRSFHTYTRSCDRPFDAKLITAMNQCAMNLCTEIQGAQLAYVQSDEISILIHPYKKHTSQGWFDNQIQKMVSISAAIASSTMTEESVKIFGEVRKAHFDSRVFVIPEDDVCNYFLARQNDWTRNSVQMMARSLFSHKECHKKNNSQLQDMIHGAGKNWNDLDIHLKRGQCIVKETYEVPAVIRVPMAGEFDTGMVVRSRWTVDMKIPIFTQDREYIDKYLVREE